LVTVKEGASREEAMDLFSNFKDEKDDRAFEVWY